MLVRPVAAPTPASVETGTSPHSPDAIDRAKAAFSGVTSRPSDNPIDAQLERTRNSVRSLRMKTNATPERFVQEANQNAISDTVGQTNEATEETKPLSPQYVALARRRRALQVKERELAAQQAQLTSQTPGTESADAFKLRLKQEPLSAFKEAGLTYDQITEAILANQNVNPEIQSLKDELKTLREGLDNKLQERDSQAEQQVLDEMQREATELVKSDDFEAIRKTNGIPHVMQLIKRTYRQTGEVLDVADAMKLVEDEIIRDGMSRLGDINKFKTAFAPKPAPQPQQQQRQMRTLTNRDTSVQPMSSKARAIAAFQGNLKR